ncbi:MAG: hypothetical protein HGA22_07065, partial [Clostridiales bacterium]|nr:hypothetical protein [Clostridiales bacterium]
LDEALFTVPWVTDFRAELSGAEETRSGNLIEDVLTIDVRKTKAFSVRISREADGAVSEIITALMSVKPVREAVEGRSLRLAVNIFGASADMEKWPVSTGTAKRTLVDSRKVV